MNLNDSSSNAQPPSARYTPNCTGKGNPAPTDQPPTHPRVGVALVKDGDIPRVARTRHLREARTVRWLQDGGGLHGWRRVDGVRDVAGCTTCGA